MRIDLKDVSGISSFNYSEIGDSVRLGIDSLVDLSRGDVSQSKQPIGIESRLAVWDPEREGADWIEGLEQRAAQPFHEANGPGKAILVRE